MPPKPKYTREEIVEVALQMTRARGIESVVARELAKKLGTSSSPIFTAFSNMEELQNEVRKVALKEFENCVRDAMNYTPVFKYIGLKMIEFAAKEPKLFQLVYVREHGGNQTYRDLIAELGDTVDVCLGVMKDEYNLTQIQAEQLFRQVWLHTFAICVLIAGKVCKFTPEEISEILSMEFKGVLMLIKSGKFQVTNVEEK